MTIALSNPEGLHATDMYHQVSVATGTRLVFIAGQVAVDAKGAKVGVGDLAVQVERAYLNVATAVAGVGGSIADIAKLTVYVTDWTLDKMPQFLEGIGRAAAALEAGALPPASLIGVSVLFDPDFLVEIEATAVLE